MKESGAYTNEQVPELLFIILPPRNPEIEITKARHRHSFAIIREMMKTMDTKTNQNKIISFRKKQGTGCTLKEVKTVLLKKKGIY